MKITTTRKVAYRSDVAMDLYVDGELREELYKRWGTGISKYGWSEPISMRGGVFTITVKMFKEIPQKELENVYKKRLTKKLQTAVASVVIV